MSELIFILDEARKDLDSLKREMQNLVAQRQQADERIAMQRGAIAYIELLLEKMQGGGGGEAVGEQTEVA